jgi:large subunit ribosomal protein L14
MLLERSIVNVADNSGAKVGRIFRILGSTRKRYARIGDLVILSVQIAEPRKLVKKKEIVPAVVVRTTNAFRRKDGSYVRFDENAVVLLDKAKKEPRGGRIFGPIPRELGEMGFQSIISKAPEVV